MDLNIALDAATARIKCGEGESVVADLCDLLRQTLHAVSPTSWQQEIIPLCRSHPIHALLLEDPYTGRAFLKPRGYAGDAEMLDYVYSGAAPAGTTPVGQAVFRGTTGGPNGRSVVFRRDWLASRIDQIAATRADTRVLSIACGHLREAARSFAVANGLVKEYVGVDQDARSLEFTAREAPFGGQKLINARVMDIINGRLVFDDFDFIYAAGLFDYLPFDLAQRLLAMAFASLRPGGWLLIGNFTPDNHGRGFMACFMDWTLMCRDEAGLEELCASIRPNEVADQRTYRDPGRNVVYLELQRA